MLRVSVWIFSHCGKKVFFVFKQYLIPSPGCLFYKTQTKCIKGFTQSIKCYKLLYCKEGNFSFFFFLKLFASVRLSLISIVKCRCFHEWFFEYQFYMLYPTLDAQISLNWAKSCNSNLQCSSGIILGNKESQILGIDDTKVDQKLK